MLKALLPAIKPRWYQIGALVAFALGCRRMVLSWPRRHGKDTICFSIMVREAQRRVGTYYYYFPTLEDGKEILWDNVTTIDGRSGTMVELLCPECLIESKSETEYTITFKNGSIIKLGGTDKLKVIGVDGIGYVFSEWQSQKEAAFDLVRPILRENRGWVLFNGTMRGKANHLYKDIKRNFGLKGWYCEWLLPTQTEAYYWESPPELEGPMRIDLNLHLKGQINPETGYEYDNIQDEVDSGMSYAMARQEFLNEAVAEFAGAYFTYELEMMRIEKRIGAFGGITEKDRIWTIWDIGIEDKMAVALVKQVGSRKRVVGYYEDSGHEYKYYFDKLKTMGCQWAGHYVPHDAQKRGGESLKNFKSVAAENGFPCRLVRKATTVKADIETCRKGLKDWEFDTDGEEMELFQDHIHKYRENKKTGRPDHSDDSSNGGDALRTGIMADALGLWEDYIADGMDLDGDVYEFYEHGENDEIEDDYQGYCLDV